MNNQEAALVNVSPRLTSQNLAKQIFAADLPEQYIRTVPAQALYAAVKRNGLQTSSDIIEIATIEQCRLMIDFDCWEKSFFYEENFWQWLEITTEEDDLTLLQKLLKCFDLKIIALLISRYVSYEFFEEGTDLPPGPGYYTPDQGRSWISINLEDSSKHFLFGRLMALIFETNADLFYQLLTLSTTSTPATLEEESYQDKCKRLSAEGVPDHESAHKINSPISLNQVRALLNKSQTTQKVIDIQAVEPLIFDTIIIKPLSALFEEISILEDLENELTYILNAAIVYWGIEFYEYDKTLRITNKVKGAINLGLEKCQELTGGASLIEIYRSLGLRKIYQLGLEQLQGLRKHLKNVQKNLQESMTEGDVDLILTLGTQSFPEMPMFSKPYFKKDENSPNLATEPVAIEHLSEILILQEFVAKSQ